MFSLQSAKHARHSGTGKRSTNGQLKTHGIQSMKYGQLNYQLKMQGIEGVKLTR